MILTHLTLLELIEGASDQQIEIMLPSNEFVDISNWFSIDYKPSKKRKKLMKDAALALKRGHGERMRHKLLARLEAAMQAGLTNGFRQRTGTRSIRPRI
jgi:hypothetical protein